MVLIQALFFTVFVFNITIGYQVLFFLQSMWLLILALWKKVISVLSFWRLDPAQIICLIGNAI